MIKGIFDSHAHYDDSCFDADRDIVLTKISEHNKVNGIINCGCDIKSSLKAIELSYTYPFIYAAVAIHPSEVEDIPADWLTQIKAMITNEKVYAIGEIGLDYHWETPLPDIQKKVFESQLSLAKEANLPVIIHSRDATNDTMSILKKYKPKGVLHCFSGSVETAEEVLKMGMYIGFTGVITFKNAKRALEVAKAVPLDRILLETDCPYMAPEPFRGKRTTSDMIEYTAAKIAEIKNISTQEMVDIARNNTKQLFSIS